MRQALSAFFFSVLTAGALLLATPAPAQAQQPADDRERLLAAQSATLGVEVRVVPGAGSANSLGRRREGVQIYYRIINGQVLTICRAMCQHVATLTDPASDASSG